MLGFTLPLLALAALEGVVALMLLLPIPLARPAIWLCQRSQGQVGQTVLMTVSGFLVVLTAAPLYDLLSLHKMKYESKGSNVNTSEARETEATSNLSAMLTVSGLVTLFVVRRLGLALGELDHKGGWSNTKEVQGGETVKTE